MVQQLTVTRVAERLAVSWNTANNAVLAEGQRVPVDGPGRHHQRAGRAGRPGGAGTDDPHRFDGVAVIIDLTLSSDPSIRLVHGSGLSVP